MNSFVMPVLDKRLDEALKHYRTRFMLLTRVWTSLRAAGLIASGHPTSCHTVTEQVFMYFPRMDICLIGLATISDQQSSAASHRHPPSRMAIADSEQGQAHTAMAFQLTFRWTNWRT